MQWKHREKFSPRIDRAFDTVSNVLVTQRKSLQRITDERAEAQDQLIQERIVQERQRLARELHDSVSQQLFAASMLLSALQKANENTKTQKPLLQVERMVQQAQLEMRALLLHLRPAALNNKSLEEGLEELISRTKRKSTIRYSLSLGRSQACRKAQKIIFSALHKKLYRIHFAMRKRQKSMYYSSNGMVLSFSASKITASDLKKVMEKAAPTDYKT